MGEVIIAFLIGTVVGVVIMCLVAAGRNNDD